MTIQDAIEQNKKVLRSSATDIIRQEQQDYLVWLLHRGAKPEDEIDVDLMNDVVRGRVFACIAAALEEHRIVEED
jgi:hypothetical protein